MNNPVNQSVIQRIIIRGLICLVISGLSVFTELFAQVPVSQEPRHHKVLDNGYVRLLDVQIPPGDTTQFHIHATPSVFVVLTNAKTGSDVISEEDRSASPISKYDNIWFEGFYVKPRVHRVYNGDEHMFHVMDIELTSKKYHIIDPPLNQKGFLFLFEEKPVRAYRLTLIAGQSLSVQPRKADILIIRLNDSTEQKSVSQVLYFNHRAYTRSLRYKGDYSYLEAGKSFDLTNAGSETAEFAFFELK
jgi:hypothetical protein